MSGPPAAVLAAARAVLTLQDTDGDVLTFLLLPDGRLQEFCNDKLEIADLRQLQYSRAAGTIKDDSGSFDLRIHDRAEKAFALRSLSAAAGVAWIGDEPVLPSTLQIVDTDGNLVEFALVTGSRLQESVNGNVVSEAVSELHYSHQDCSLRDGLGVRFFQPGEHFAKASVLRALASGAGGRWTGDEPVPSVERPPAPAHGAVLEIEDCARDWELLCPKRWDSLSATARPDERFCEVCKETVYYCSTLEQLAEHTGQRRCVAFELRAPTEAPLAPTAAPTEAQAPTVRRLMGKRVARKG